MATLGLQKGEGAGLAVAVALHAGLLVLLVLRPTEQKQIIPPPQRIEVSISDEVGLTSTSPDPFSRAAADEAPTLGDPAPASPSEPEAAPQPDTKPEPAPEPVKETKPAPKPQPAARPAPKPQPRPAPKPAPKPSAKPSAKPRAEPSRTPPKTPSTRRTSAIDDIVSAPRSSAAAGSSRATQPPRKAGGSKVGANFLDGIPGASAQSGSGIPAAAIGPTARSALSASITRQLKPHWSPPSGADADKLVTVLSFNLNKDGSLSGTPRVVRQTGITDSNRAQAARHAEQAIRAVQLASPFNLPSEYYEAWKRVSSFEFDLRLSQ